MTEREKWMKDGGRDEDSQSALGYILRCKGGEQQNCKERRDTAMLWKLWTFSDEDAMTEFSEGNCGKYNLTFMIVSGFGFEILCLLSRYSWGGWIGGESFRINYVMCLETVLLVSKFDHTINMLEGIQQ